MFRNNEKGFSLMEVLVAVTVFSLFIVLTLGVFATFARESRRAKVSRVTADTAHTIILSLQSGLGRAVITNDLDCRLPATPPSAVRAYSASPTGREVVFKTADGECRGYRFEPPVAGKPSGTLYQFTHITTASPRIAPFTTEEVGVRNLSFRVYDDDASNVPPMVQVTMVVESLLPTISVKPLKLQFVSIVPSPFNAP
jgi:prepilin-type N-terminal cleavage/methylation domain-containing protein